MRAASVPIVDRRGAARTTRTAERYLGWHIRLAALAALAGWVMTLSWRVLTAEFARTWIPLALVALLVVGSGAVARWRRWPAAALVPVQIVIAGLTVTWAVTGSVLPTPSNIGALLTAINDAVESARAFAAPVPASASPVHPLLLVAGAGVLVMMDLCVGTLRRASFSGLVLLTAYTLPVAVTGDGVSWWIFVATATLFLGSVYVQHSDQLAAWSRTADTDAGGFSVRTGAVASTATSLGVGAIGLALVASFIIPTMRMALFEGGAGSGTRQVEVKNPVADMRRDLTRGQDVPLLWVTTDGPRPDYFRLSVLTRYVDGRWTPGDREIPESQPATGELPPLDGVSPTLPREEARYRIRVSPDFDSSWLPTTSQVTSINAGPDWRYDISTRDFIAGKEDVTTARRTYDFTGVTLKYDPQAMNQAVSGAGTVRSIFTEVPSTLNTEIRRLAATVTADAPTRYQKAQALQDFFRVDGGFRYDLKQADSLGSDAADLLAFLDEETGRVGYCEQFAGAMAIMARTLGIPSRVAIGFLKPQRSTDGAWEFSAWDMHAWPELYFPGSGWVTFEPTPAARAAEPPGYTTAEFEQQEPSASPSLSDSAEELPERGEIADVRDSAVEEEQFDVPWAMLVLAVLGLALVVAVALTPRLVRRRRYLQAMADGVEGVWTELRATARDLGHTWPEGRSPRRTGEWVGRLLAAPDPVEARSHRPRRGRGEAPEAANALDRLVDALERSRYSRSAEVFGDSLREDADTVVESMRCGVSGRVIRRADWWPRSIFDARRRLPARLGPDRESLDVERVNQLAG